MHTTKRNTAATDRALSSDSPYIAIMAATTSRLMRPRGSLGTLIPSISDVSSIDITQGILTCIIIRHILTPPFRFRFILDNSIPMNTWVILNNPSCCCFTLHTVTLTVIRPPDWLVLRFKGSSSVPIPPLFYSPYPLVMASFEVVKLK